MDLVIEALVFVVQLALAGFLAWGGWLCVRYGRPAPQPPVAKPKTEEASAEAFERVASLVLLALLFAAVPGVLR